MNFLPIHSNEVRDVRTPSQVRRDLVVARLGPQRGLLKSTGGLPTRALSTERTECFFDGHIVEVLDHQQLIAARDLLAALHANEIPSYVHFSGKYFRVPDYYWSPYYANYEQLVSNPDEVVFWEEDYLWIKQGQPVPPHFYKASIVIPGDAARQWIAIATSSVQEPGSNQMLSSVELPRSDRTGAAGRPTSMHLIRILLEQRALNGSIAEKLSYEAKALFDLFSADPANVNLAKPKAGAIANAIRSRYNELIRKTTK